MSDTPTPPAQEQPRKEISAEEFIKIWKGDYKGVAEYEEFYQDRFDEELIVFDGYYVVDGVSIKDVQSLPNIEFRNTITNYFELKNSLAGYFRILDNSAIGYFKILDNSVTDYFEIRGNSTTGNFSIVNNSRTGNFSILDKSTTGNFWILDKSTTGYFSILYNSRTGNFGIYNSRTGYFRIRDNSRTGYFEINNSTIGNFSIRDNSTIGNFSIQNNSVINSIEVNKSSIESIIIKDDVYVDRLKLSYINTACKTLMINSSTIGVLILQLDKAYQLTIKSEEQVRTQIHSLEFNETIFTKDANIHISDTDINQMKLDYFLNRGIIVFNNITSMEDVKYMVLDKKGMAVRYDEGEQKGEYKFEKVNKASKISLINSDLGNTQFIGCNLSSFDKFVFKNSKMANVFLADTSLPDRSEITSTKWVDENEQKRLALSQFKKIYEGQGDLVRAAEFRAEEMEVYREQLKVESSKKFSKDWWNNKSERVNLWLSMFSNYYGNNWLKAVGWTLVINLVLFTAYCSSRSIYPANPFNVDNLKEFGKISPYYLEFLLPLHKTDFFDHIKDASANSGALFIDFLSRIILAYMVYQTVAAFRKFGRK